MPNLFTGGSNSCVKHFEIRVNQDHLILRGSPDEASSVLLQGSVVLCTSEALRVQGVGLKFVGQVKLPETRHVNNINEEFYTHNFKFDDLVKPSTTLPAGNVELPFSLVLPGTMYESIEGMRDSWLIYRLKATIDRGRFAKNVECRKHIRIIRTFDSSSLELAHEMSLDNIWPDKVKYNITSPSKGIVFGSVAQIDFSLVPLVKGLKIGKITTNVSETCRFLDPTAMILGTKLLPEREIVVVKEEYRIPEDAETEEIDGSEGYRHVQRISLPRSLRKCRQSVDNEKWMAIRHKLNFVIELINPDGHVSEIRANLPVHLFISPNNTVNEENELQGPIQINRGDLGDNDNLAPPLYGEHQWDRLYGSVDSGSFITFQSGNTPSYTPSVQGSDEIATAPASATERTVTDVLTANTLQNRLQNLTVDWTSRHMRRDGSPEGAQPPNGDSGTNSGNQSPTHLDFDDEELLRIPSYATALRTPHQNISTTDLPDYFTSTSRPGTPRCSAVSLSRRHSPPSHHASGHSTPHRHVHYAAEPSRA